jgi:hypothetical protein
MNLLCLDVRLVSEPSACPHHVRLFIPQRLRIKLSARPEDFSNNLLGHLAPLLTLFGEQVTKQFLSMSLGWADNFLIAMGPLGIMTIIVSTIRVGCSRHLKALIGRTRESRATAEVGAVDIDIGGCMRDVGWPRNCSYFWCLKSQTTDPSTRGGLTDNTGQIHACRLFFQ